MEVEFYKVRKTRGSVAQRQCEDSLDVLGSLFNIIMGPGDGKHTRQMN